MTNTHIKRNRNVAHSWWDKRITRFFRHWHIGKYYNEITTPLSKNDFKHLTVTYMALCEIDSDFTEARNNPNKVIASLLNTVATYAGIHRNTACTYMKMLRSMGLIEYGRKFNDRKECIGSFLEMYEFNKDEIIKNITTEPLVRGSVLRESTTEPLVRPNVLTPKRTYASPYYYKNTKVDKPNNEFKEDKSNKESKDNLCDFDFEQNEPISSVSPLGNSSVQKPKVSGRPARKPIQEIVVPEPMIVAPDPHLIIVTDLERISKKFCPNNKITPSQSKAWLSEIKKLFKHWSGSVDNLHQMLRTYYTNYDPKNKYHVVIRSGSSLKEKINQLESFCDRINTDSKPAVKRYQENFKSDTKGKYDNIKEEVINMDEED